MLISDWSSDVCSSDLGCIRVIASPAVPETRSSKTKYTRRAHKNMNYGFDFGFVTEFWPSLLEGTWLSIKMSTLALLLGFIAGVALAVAKTEGGYLLRGVVTAFVDITRNTPLVVQAFWLFFGLAALHIRVPAFYAAIVALTINTSGYTCEIVRAGMESDHKGQKETAPY